MNNILGVFSGALIAVMIYLNGILASFMGNYTSTVTVHIVGLITIIIVLLVKKLKVSIKRKIPLYMYSAGAIGVFTVLFNNLTFSKLGVSLTIALGLFGQSVSSIIIDHFGLLGMKKIKFNQKKIFGFVFIILGILSMAIF